MAHGKHLLFDREVNNLVLYSIALSILAGIAFLSFSYDEKVNHFVPWSNLLGLVGGILGIVFSCIRNQGLATTQMVALSISVIFKFYAEFEYIYLLLVKIIWSWGYNAAETLFYFWCLCSIFAAYLFLGIGILFGERVRSRLSFGHSDLKTGLI